MEKRKARSPFVLRQERAVPGDGFLGPFSELSKGPVLLPDPKGSSRVCLPIVSSFSPGRVLALGSSAAGFLYLVGPGGTSD